MSYSFGLVQLDVVNYEVTNSYFTDNFDVNASSVIDDVIYMSTDDGIYQGNPDVNLNDFVNWIQHSTAQNLPVNYTSSVMEFFDDKLFADNNDTLMYYDGAAWQHFRNKRLGNWSDTFYNVGNTNRYLEASRDFCSRFTSESLTSSLRYTVMPIFSLTELDIDLALSTNNPVTPNINSTSEMLITTEKYDFVYVLSSGQQFYTFFAMGEVFKSVNAQGVVVHSFKVPTEKELKHDYLWRHYIALPEKGKIGVFNRTHYENVLVTRVHPEYIFGENIPSIKSVEDLGDAFYHDRMNRINDFENHLVKNGTIVLKFFLNLSKDEQKNRLLRRLNIPEKNWKFSDGDLKERKLWDKYMFCYEDLLNRTSKENAPWFVIPADDKPTARTILAKILLEELEKYNFTEPKLSGKLLSKLDSFKAELNNE